MGPEIHQLQTCKPTPPLLGFLSRASGTCFSTPAWFEPSLLIARSHYTRTTLFGNVAFADHSEVTVKYPDGLYTESGVQFEQLLGAFRREEIQPATHTFVLPLNIVLVTLAFNPCRDSSSFSALSKAVKIQLATTYLSYLWMSSTRRVPSIPAEILYE